MWKKKKFIIPMVAAVTLVAILAGSAFAQEEEIPSPPEGTLIERLADKLGIEQGELEQAFKEVVSEMREDALNYRLDKLVEEGKLTEEEAEQFLEWWQDRPDIGPGGLGAGFGGRGGFFGPALGPRGSAGPGSLGGNGCWGDGDQT